MDAAVGPQLGCGGSGMEKGEWDKCFRFSSCLLCVQRRKAGQGGGVPLAV